MSTVTSTQPTVAPPPPAAALRLHRITVDEYERIGAAGALENPSRIELIDGYMVDKMPKNPEHSFTTEELRDALKDRLPPGWTPRQEQPVRIPDFDEPEPDISIVRGSKADYRHRIPVPADVALLVEVSESSLSEDRGPKCSAFAKGWILVSWIVNLVARQVEVYSRSGKGGYRSRVDFKPGQQVPVMLGGQALRPIAVEAILP